MRRAKYSAKKVYLPNASRLGFDTSIARPGSWITYLLGTQHVTARVLGRIDETPRDGLEDCSGWLAVLRLNDGADEAFVAWVDPKTVIRCHNRPPRALLAWITGDEWAKRGSDVAFYIAMSQHGTTCDRYIESRHDPERAYCRRPEYVDQFNL